MGSCASLILSTVVAALAAPLMAADALEPAALIGQHPVLTVQANDVPRSLERFAESPYADYADTAWGALLVERLSSAFAPRSARVDLEALTASIERIAIGVGVREEDRSPDIRWAVSTSGDVRPMQDLCREFTPEIGGSAGRIVQFGRVFSFRRAGVETPAAARATRFPDACVELSLDPGQLTGALGLAPFSAQPADDGRRVAVGLRLDPIGLRERWDLPIPQAHRRAWGETHLPVAQVELLAGLPESALLGCTFTADATSGVAAFAASGLVDEPLALVALDLSLARAGLPPLLDLLSGLRGDTLLWVEGGTPYPSFTALVGMDERLARRILPILALDADLSPGRDGTLIGFLGVCGCEAGYRDGRLIVTTRPDGVAGALAHHGGFAADRDGAAALAEIPAGAVFAGVSRSGPAAGALARLALAPLAHFGLPQLATLPRDLEHRGRHGFIAIRQVDDGLRLDAGGLLGGPCATYAALGGAAWATYLAAESRVRRALDQLREAPSAPVEATAKRL